MSRLVSFLTALWLSSASAQVELFQDFGKSVQNEVQAAVDPVGKAVAYVGSSACQLVKQLGNVEYEDYEGNQPDMSQLTLDFYDNKGNMFSYNLSTAAEYIPKERWYNASCPLKVFLHGFTDDPSKDSFQTIRKAFLASDECINLLALDASSMIKWLYLRSTTMVRFIGEKLGAVLDAMHNYGLKADRMHLIGHSLGVHIASFASKNMKVKVGRISGLDPAGPCFANLKPELRITSNDACFVDAIHTDLGVYGLNAKVGHVDFYPNSGSEQPNCLFQTCSHSRAWQLFAESVVKQNSFIGVKCNTWEDFRKGKCSSNDTSIMGYACSPDTRGTYYLQTNGETPYGRGLAGIKYEQKVEVVRTIKNGVFDFLG